MLYDVVSNGDQRYLPDDWSYIQILEYRYNLETLLDGRCTGMPGVAELRTSKNLLFEFHELSHQGPDLPL